MQERLEYLRVYLRASAGVALICALLEVIFALRFHFSFFKGNPVGTLEVVFLIAYAVLFLIFASVSWGLWSAPTWFYGVMIFLCAIGSILLAAALVFGLLLGGG